ncbi:NAD(P)(+) transhydrogenase (Re/Si-specific) subunit beta [Frankia sp. CNm7]|uniref:NAD(P) transhydrogenase subunit beta n=1 Tax=Frankia nepalensis TaxID=1836974 RepID=A0A937RBM3_9ACTN|nr:NAD(P)(+) transhydrogenase (Re/Si-specific) subunit beta [Frankia nepalensis]MBL7501851.1 NAD(P)(+) transhydrogenase (Re/Si-specific) subunit beta [Frankia nepalensis]MBL7515015.1 NAD(P)(+) transhydrogenase (Re/Si-specific) subunit beta [Frankia nepalensis]MBL7518725.1 NAD(P)(+) transhydrogenase (Re/Si-specific) subunit beta [Frankia nepalensis]MBL7625939.1 NAD(P)(+) transhydrogenase (Re/Si-specific) subunit beta [Frankia nepalensis]
MNDYVIPLCYLAAGGLFIVGLKGITQPKTARRGLQAAELGMLFAIVGTLLHKEIIDFTWIIIAFVVGSVIGALMAVFVPMTAMPQRIALSHAFGALAAGLVGTAEYYNHQPEIGAFTMAAITLEVLLGFLTFTGSLMAFGKLHELLPGRPQVYPGQNYVNISVLLVAVGAGVWLVVDPAQTWLFPVIAVLAAAFGVMLIIPIGGADMPTVISLLNSYAGLSAVAMGFALDNKALIIAGALDGSAGFLLSVIMCRAMNRSFTNVLFGAFGQADTSAAAGGAVEERPVRSATTEEAAMLLETARSVIIVPGYGLAVAQAQHRIRELADVLTRNGAEVRFAIHPVAGRMPGHMNVLLAEADVPYDQILDMDEINADFAQTDIALVVGANDVTNPAARTDKNSPIYGMPILDVDAARTVMVVKRGMKAGFAGVENELYFQDKTLMIFGDAKKVAEGLVHDLEATVRA